MNLPWLFLALFAAQTAAQGAKSVLPQDPKQERGTAKRLRDFYFSYSVAVSK
jgi:hypothetical protein